MGNRLWDVPVTGPDGSRILSEEVKTMNAQIPDYADTSHADIVTRDLKGRKPFRQNGKGYRGTLLWETIVRHCIAANALTLFVTQKVRDFCDTDHSLHKELFRDVRSARKARATKLQFRGTYRPLPINTSSHIEQVDETSYEPEVDTIDLSREFQGSRCTKRPKCHHMSFSSHSSFRLLFHLPYFLPQ